MYLHFYLLATVDTVDADKGPALDADAARNRVQSWEAESWAENNKMSALILNGRFLSSGKMNQKW